MQPRTRDRNRCTLTPPTIVAQQREKALARWDNEGGAGPDGPQNHDLGGGNTETAFEPTNMEMQRLHARIIGLESLVTALLAGASVEQRKLAREIALNISPHQGSTRHPLTLQAARQMLEMIARADHFTASDKPGLPPE